MLKSSIQIPNCSLPDIALKPLNPRYLELIRIQKLPLSSKDQLIMNYDFQINQEYKTEKSPFQFNGA